MGLKRKKRLLGILIFSLVIGMMGSAGGEAEAKKKIILNKKKAVIYVGGQLRLKVKGTKKKVKWSSKEKKIATVSKKGVVKGKRAGKTKITAKVKGKKLVCRLTVKAKKKADIKPGVTKKRIWRTKRRHRGRLLRARQENRQLIRQK